jgi:hypothetical protein
LSLRFNIPRFSPSGLYLEVILGLRYRSVNFAETHYWLALSYAGEKRILRIDGAYDQFDPVYEGLIVADDYVSSLQAHRLFEIKDVFRLQAEEYFNSEDAGETSLGKFLSFSKNLSLRAGLDFSDLSQQEICLIRLYHWYLLNEHLSYGNWPRLDPGVDVKVKKVLGILMKNKTVSLLAASSPVNSLRGASKGMPIKKCLVLDCDGVLWQGIVGEDGLKGIKVTSQHLKFQKKVRELKEKGIILAINSKNNLKDVLEVLESHPAMVLRKDDFVVIKANWND